MRQILYLGPGAIHEVLRNIHSREKSLPEAGSGVIYGLLSNGVRGCASHFIGATGRLQGLAQ